MTKPYTWTVKFTIAPEWIADGFVMSDQRAADMLAHALPYANPVTELKAQVLVGPSPLQIAGEQGYSGKHVDRDKIVREIMQGAPHAYNDMSVDNAIYNASVMLDAMAFARQRSANQIMTYYGFALRCLTRLS